MMKGNAAKSNPSAAFAHLTIRPGSRSGGHVDCYGLNGSSSVTGELMAARTLCCCCFYMGSPGRFFLHHEAIALLSKYVSIQTIQGKWVVSFIYRRPDYHHLRLPLPSRLPLLEFEIPTPGINTDCPEFISFLATLSAFTTHLILPGIHRPLTNPVCYSDLHLPPTNPSLTHHDRDWANIPDELLIFDIGKKLSIADYIRIAAVCKSWFNAANSLRPPLTLEKKPYMMVFPARHPRSNYLLDVATINVTQLIDSPPQIAGKWCVGSQQGRLVLLDEFSNVSVLNPLTGSYIRLPDITTIPGVTPCYDPNDSSRLLAYDYRELGDHIGCQLLYKIDEFRERIGMKKVVFSHDFTFALSIFGVDDDILAYLRPGDRSWTTINTRTWEGAPYDSILDIICRDGGDGGGFLVVLSRGHVFSLDIAGPSVKMTCIGGRLNHRDYHYADRYLVDISGEIMQVCRKYKLCRTVQFSVFRLDLLSSTWTLVDNLGDYCLFVGMCYSMPFLTTTGGAFGLRSNCIYFANALHGFVGYDCGIQDIGVCSMNDTSIERISLDHKFMWPLPVWFMPFGS